MALDSLYQWLRFEPSCARLRSAVPEIWDFCDGNTFFFVLERYIKIHCTSSSRLLTLNTIRSYLPNAPKIVRIGLFVVENQLQHHSPPHPTLHQKVSLISQSVLHRFSSFSSRFVSTFRALSGRTVCFRLRRRSLNQHHDHDSSFSLPASSGHISLKFLSFSCPRSCFRPPSISLSPHQRVLPICSPLYPLSAHPFYHYPPVLELSLPHLPPSSPITFTH